MLLKLSSYNNMIAEIQQHVIQRKFFGMVIKFIVFLSTFSDNKIRQKYLTLKMIEFV